MAFAIGSKAIKRLCLEQHPLGWQKAKLAPQLFKPYEQDIYAWVSGHLKTFHVLPDVSTLTAHFPEMVPIEVPEPAAYYVQLLENQFFYERINRANLDAQNLLKEDQDAHVPALNILKQAVKDITEQKYRLRILDVGVEAGPLVLSAYHQVHAEALAIFGWPYMDLQSGGVMPGDVISFVGRPAVGKTWLTLWTALRNWVVKKLNILYVSMEMMTLPIAQRIAALYTHHNIAQLKMGGFATDTFKSFTKSLKALELEEAKFYVIDGNLAANVEDIFVMADMLQCPVVVIDGAYLLRHRNVRLDRFHRAAENVELIKRHCTDLDMMAFCSWQFNREASKKQKKGHGEKGDLEDIGYSDAIGQISSIALSLYQEESVETLKERKVQVMKGRNGEVGQFAINWEFATMDFSQAFPPVLGEDEHENKELQWL